MNPLEHFGIKKQFIRGDVKSYSRKGPEPTHSDAEWQGGPSCHLCKQKFDNEMDLHEHRQIEHKNWVRK